MKPPIRAKWLAVQLGDDAKRFVQEGWEMAEREGQAAFESIEILYYVELQKIDPARTHIHAQGSILLQRRDTLDSNLHERGYNPAQHLHDMAGGRVDLVWAVALSVLNGGMAVVVVLAFSPGWAAILMLFLALVSALPIEEFFQAYEEKDALREGIFLILSLLALSAQVWLGYARGMIVGTVEASAAGPVTAALAVGGSILRCALAILSVVSEVLCGWKLHRARTALLSPIAKGVHDRDSLNAQLTDLAVLFTAASTDPEIRRHYRTIGARQQIASAATAAERAKRNHLKRALRGVLIALAILAVLLLLTKGLWAASLHGHDKLVLIDPSKSVKAEQFKANVNGVSEVLDKLQPGDQVIVLGITDRFSKPAILLDKSMPPNASFFGLQEQAARETIMAAWQDASKKLSRSYDHTDLLGTLALIPYLGNLKISGSQIYIFSDLQHSTKDLDFELMETIPADRIINKLKASKTIPSLNGATIYALGIDPAGKSAVAFRSRRDFWFKFFKEAGAEIKLFTIDRHIPDMGGMH